MSPNYHAKHSISISRPAPQVTEWLSDLSKWPQWLAISQFDSDKQLSLSAQGQGVGANLFWSAHYTYGELSITQQTTDKVQFQLLINNEFLSDGIITITSTGSGCTITWEQTGDISIPVLGPYLALLAEHQLQNTLIHSLNNLKTNAELPTLEIE
ncbi:SRPBCC family protein [Pseudoalteromonas sp. SSDWG2]|uniref:SRPBCC family protein n=1 Tax=Pseudoalteromonas sp. SSDWG2 TaxID=3139391 RepID=UPI003BACB57E